MHKKYSRPEAISLIDFFVVVVAAVGSTGKKARQSVTDVPPTPSLDYITVHDGSLVKSHSFLCRGILICLPAHG